MSPLAASLIRQGDILANKWLQKRVKRRPARYWPGYFNICTSMGKLAINSFESEWVDAGIGKRLKGCAQRWALHKSDGSLLPVGCGDRCMCPLCAGYYHSARTREAIEVFRESVLEAKAQGVDFGVVWGEHYVFTLPKKLSRYMDDLRLSDMPAFRDKFNRLRQAAWLALNRAVRLACEEKGIAMGELGAMSAFHHWGSEAPWEPHYHWHFIVAPYTADYEGKVKTVDRVCGDGKHRRVPVGSECRSLVNWRALPRFWDRSEGGEVRGFTEMRKAWKRAGQRIIGMKYAGEWNAWRRYIGNADYKVDGELVSPEHELLGVIRYQLRSPMEDLWKCVKGSADRGYMYYRRGNEKAGRPEIKVPLRMEQFVEASLRAQSVGRYDFKGNHGGSVRAVSWHGLLSANKVKNTLSHLGLVREKPEREKALPGDVTYWYPAQWKEGGCWMRRDTSRDGIRSWRSGDHKEVEFVPWDKFGFNPVGDDGEPQIGCTVRWHWIHSRDGPARKLNVGG